MQLLVEEPQGWRINGNSFQQDALVTFGDYQFLGGYNSERKVFLGRRSLRKEHGEWEFITFEDYIQTRDDGHNVVCLGISGDGIIHIIWDLHNDVLNYRHSTVGITAMKDWHSGSFTSIFHQLSDELRLEKATYPRFLRIPDTGELLLELRIGRSGLGDDYLFKYLPGSAQWMTVGSNDGVYLKGVGNNAYINGIDYAGGKLHVSWTYRDFVEDGGFSSVSQQAGPNGPENNHDLYYAYSPDLGSTWYNTSGQQLELPIKPSDEIKVFTIPHNSGIMNQEGQTADSRGNFHVLNREEGFYYHYWRNQKGEWSRRQLEYEAVIFGDRGSLIADHHANLYALLPGNKNSTFTILKSTPSNNFLDWTVFYQEPDCYAEPTVDRYRLDNTLSIAQTKSTNGQTKYFGVLDLKLQPGK
jgi:hypothetical protein